MKKIELSYNHYLYSELQIQYNRILEIHGYPDSSGVLLPWPTLPSDKEGSPPGASAGSGGAAGAPGGTAKPNLMNPGFVIRYISNPQQKKQIYYVVMAWNPNTLPDCNEAPGSGVEYWDNGIIPNTKVYRNEILEDGIWFTFPIGGYDGYSWGMFFDSLEDGRLLMATGNHIYVETCKGSNEFVIVADLAFDMDPSFLILSPNKQRVALGVGYGLPLLVFNIDILDVNSPPLLIDENGNPYSEVTAYDVDYYSATWRDNQFLFINAGTWPGPPYHSAVGMLDTINPDDTGQAIISNIPGCSSGICFDKYGNLFCGVGFNESEGLTGEIYYFTPAQIHYAIYQDPIDFLANGQYVCTSLSAGHMVITPNDELVVCGGDCFGTTGQIGYAEIFQLSYSNEVLTGVGNGKQLILDPCQDDSAAGPLCLIKEKLI